VTGPNDSKEPDLDDTRPVTRPEEGTPSPTPSFDPMIGGLEKERFLGDKGEGKEPERRARWLLPAAAAGLLALVLLGTFAWVRFGPGSEIDESLFEKPLDPSGIPSPALLGTFSGTGIDASGQKRWVVLVIDRTDEGVGQTRFHFRLFRGTEAGGDGDGTYDPKGGELAFATGDEQWTARVRREKGGKLVMLAMDRVRGVSLRLRHQ
jgi:hypothetical protein